VRTAAVPHDVELLHVKRGHLVRYGALTDESPVQCAPPLCLACRAMSLYQRRDFKCQAWRPQEAVHKR
jgi:hypothetical protein